MNYDAAIRELEDKREAITAAISNLRRLAVLESTSPREPKPAAKKIAKRNFSADTRQRMADAQRRRWAAFHAAKDNGAQPHADQPVQ